MFSFYQSAYRLVCMVGHYYYRQSFHNVCHFIRNSLVYEIIYGSSCGCCSVGNKSVKF